MNRVWSAHQTKFSDKCMAARNGDDDRGGKKLGGIEASSPVSPPNAAISAHGPPRCHAAAAKAKRRKTSSTRMTVATTIRPKSMAPTESRFAPWPNSTIAPSS